MYCILYRGVPKLSSEDRLWLYYNRSAYIYLLTYLSLASFSSGTGAGTHTTQISVLLVLILVLVLVLIVILVRNRNGIGRIRVVSGSDDRIARADVDTSRPSEIKKEIEQFAFSSVPRSSRE